MALQQVAGEKSVNSPHGENLDQHGLSLTTLQEVKQPCPNS